MKPSSLIMASVAGCSILVVALAVSYRLDVERHGVAISARFHVGLFDGSAWFYSDPLPYRGSIYRLDAQPPASGIAALDLPGVYYRSISLPADNTWSLMVSLWYPIALLAIPPVLGLIRGRQVGRDRGDRR